MNTNNHNSHILLFFFPILLIISCRSERDLKRQGVVQLRSRDYDSTKREFINESFIPDLNIWFKGHLVIEEIKTINTRDSNGIRTKETPVAYYLLIDRNSKTFYNYSSFSDTARILDKYSQADTVEIPGLGGWSFYRSHNLNIVGSPRRLSDTLIKEIIYKRVELIIKNQTALLTVIGYLRCDKRGTMFQFDKNFSKKIGCPLVRIDFLPSPGVPIATSDELVFISDSLTKEELRIFDAWKKNIKRYPVNK